jgi:HEAT repeat protein
MDSVLLTVYMGADIPVMRNRKNVPALIDLLRDPDLAVRGDATLALAGRGVRLSAVRWIAL